ncbi:unnamed protein product [Staurois parvus]|uniref:Uncharacterized protein n=1 Tax=Staurois parvus TaxID=386267 RepID=A0ABN9GW78_9NEOB|nr:unnamed protein product [Staurois parvus]
MADRRRARRMANHTLEPVNAACNCPPEDQSHWGHQVLPPVDSGQPHLQHGSDPHLPSTTTTRRRLSYPSYHKILSTDAACQASRKMPYTT